jgi:DedD protein
MAQDNLQSQSEQEIQFKKRARRRLVGAIALVLLMIILLPMLLQDRVAQTPKDEVVISIPSQDSQLDTKTDEALGSLADTAQPNSAETSAMNLPSSAMPPLSEGKTPEIKPTQPSEPSAPVAQVVAKPAELPPVKEAKSALKEQEPTKLDKPLATGNFYVQIGVFSNPEKVKQLQSKLNESALKSSTELIETPKGTKTRLRVGMFSSKSEAEAALVKVKALGLSDAVVGN